MQELSSSADQKKFKSDNKLALIFFGSMYCPHCMDMKPLVEDYVTIHENIAFAHVEVSGVKVENIPGVPIFAGYVNGVFYDEVVGADVVVIVWPAQPVKEIITIRLTNKDRIDRLYLIFIYSPHVLEQY